MLARIHRRGMHAIVAIVHKRMHSDAWIVPVCLECASFQLPEVVQALMHFIIEPSRQVVGCIPFIAGLFIFVASRCCSIFFRCVSAGYIGSTNWCSRAAAAADNKHLLMAPRRMSRTAGGCRTTRELSPETRGFGFLTRSCDFETFWCLT